MNRLKEVRKAEHIEQDLPTRTNVPSTFQLCQSNARHFKLFHRGSAQTLLKPIGAGRIAYHRCSMRRFPLHLPGLLSLVFRPAHGDKAKAE